MKKIKIADLFYFTPPERNGILILLSSSLCLLIIGLWFKNQPPKPIFTQRLPTSNEKKTSTSHSGNTIANHKQSQKISDEKLMGEGFSKEEINLYRKYEEQKLTNIKDKKIHLTPEFQQKIKRLTSQSIFTETDHNLKSYKPLFLFDPNTVDVEQLNNTIIPDKVLNTIKNYRQKGGRFKKPEDLGRIFGMTPELLDQVLPFISIQEISIVAAPTKSTEEETSIQIDIGQADSIELLKIHGIGPVYASMILRYRNKCGGFYQVDQIQEIKFFPDSVFQKTKNQMTCTPKLKFLRINELSEDQLIHPYISRKQAKILVNYRKQHGFYQSGSDLIKAFVFTEPEWNRIKPYLIF